MENKKQDTCYVSETITIIRPQLKNKIFNETDYKLIQTYDENDNKVIWFREVIKQEKIENKMSPEKHKLMREAMKDAGIK